ncbi:MAG: hypothetical protein UZ05_CHB002001638 [Chlorobi bacterium OLB5]|nr:MAG: hypothetical protein UZ05_CHB002001638 [Chlorobi bacterium OLB5]
MSENKINIGPGELLPVISSNFEIVGNKDISMDELKMMLASRIREMLDTNLEKLVSILYRIDVGQRLTDEIFSENNKEDIAPLLAEAIIKRQIQKIQTRKKYSSE